MREAVRIGVDEDRARRRGLTSGEDFLMVTPWRGGGGLLGAVTGESPPPPVLQGSLSCLSESSPRIVFITSQRQNVGRQNVV